MQNGDSGDIFMDSGDMFLLRDNKQLVAKTQRAPFRPLCRRDRRSLPYWGI